MTRAQLERFVAIRNKSLFSSNLQFQIDLEEVGLTLAELGEVQRPADFVWRWETPVGTLTERDGQMELT